MKLKQLQRTMAYLYETAWKPSEEDLPIVVYDFRVFLYSILNCVARCNKNRIRDLEGDMLDKYISTCWMVLFNNPVPQTMNKSKLGYQVCIVDDQRYKTKNTYWRNNLFPQYKGNRDTERSDLYKLIYKLGMEYATIANIQVFRQNGFEADDQAAMFARVKRSGVAKGRTLFLCTSDFDWAQLINDEHNIYWSNALHYLPRLRNEQSFLEVFSERDYGIDRLTDLAEWKRVNGDAGDNLLPDLNPPIEVIDLLDPPKKPKAKPIKDFMKQKFDSVKPVHYKSARHWILKNKLLFPKF